MAQKYPEATIHAIEVEPDAAKATKENFEKSSFTNPFQVFESDFLELLIAAGNKSLNTKSIKIKDKCSSRHAILLNFAANILT